MKRSLAVVVVLVLFISLFYGCAPRTSQQATLVFAKGGDAVELDPADVTDGESVTVMNNIFEGLVRYKPGTTEVEPWLATSWDVSSDGLVWTFHLREGIKFHDGTPFNADAVFSRLKDQSDPNHHFTIW